MIQYDPHAEFQIRRRGISLEWIEETLRNPDETENKGNKRSFLKCYTERGKMLRVVVRDGDPQYVTQPISIGEDHAPKSGPTG